MENTNELNNFGSGLLPFDPIVMFYDVVKRWLVILLAAIMVGVGSYIATDMAYEPVYQTNTIFVVTAKGSSATVYSNLNSTTKLAELFTDLLNSSIMRKTIMEEMGVSSLDATISTSVIPYTNLISMTVRSSNPRTAFLTTEALIENHEFMTYQIVDGIVLEVLQNPSVPTAPIDYANASGQMRKMMILAALAAVALLAVMSYMRNAVRSGSEVQAKLDCDYLGEIPHEKRYKTLLAWLRHKKISILITNPVTSFRYVENMNKLRRRVEHHMDGDKVLMVTSLLENEGKSTVAVNLALAMSQKNKKVLLIDGDLRKPACHLLLGQKFNAGVKEVLLGKENVRDVILRYKKTDMYMMLGKKADRYIGDLIASERMDVLLKWARNNFDFVVLDLPPICAAPDAEGVAGLADACLLVVRQNAAVAPALNKAIESLEKQNAKMLGCVLNNVYASRMLDGSGYGYGYGGYHRYNRYGGYGSKNVRK